MIDNSTMTTDQAQNGRQFNPNEHLMQIKNRGGSADYLPVQWRLVWFRSLFPQGTIETEIVHLDLERETEEEKYEWNNETRRSEKVIKRAPGFAVFRATVRDGQGGVATGTKSEKAASFPDFLEKAETGAIGRALAALGYGTQFAGDEFDEKHRIVDAPVDHGSAGNPPTHQGNGREKGQGHTTTAQSEQVDPNAPVTQQQINSIANISQRLGKEPVTPANFGAAKELIAQLSQEYRQSRPKAS